MYIGTKYIFDNNLYFFFPTLITRIPEEILSFLNHHLLQLSLKVFDKIYLECLQLLLKIQEKKLRFKEIRKDLLVPDLNASSSVCKSPR